MDRDEVKRGKSHCCFRKASLQQKSSTYATERLEGGKLEMGKRNLRGERTVGDRGTPRGSIEKPKKKARDRKKKMFIQTITPAAGAGGEGRGGSGKREKGGSSIIVRAVGRNWGRIYLPTSWKRLGDFRRKVESNRCRKNQSRRLLRPLKKTLGTQGTKE